MIDDRTRPNGSVVVTIELPGANSLSYVAISMSEPLSKLAALRTTSNRWYVYDEATRKEVTTLRPGSARNWDTPIGEFGVEAGSAISIWPRRRKVPA